MFDQIPDLHQILSVTVDSDNRCRVFVVVFCFHKFCFHVEFGEKLIVFWVFFFQASRAVEAVYQERLSTSSIDMLQTMQDLKTGKIILKDIDLYSVVPLLN